MDDCIRILYLVDTLDDPSRGLLPHLVRLTKHLDPGQFKLRVIIVRGEPPESEHQSLLGPVERLGMGKMDPISLAAARLRLYRKLRGANCDLICAYGWAARAIGLPVAERANPALRLSFVRDMGFGTGPRALQMLQRNNGAASRFVAASSAVASRLMRQEKVDRDLIDIIPSGIDCQRFPERTPLTTMDAKHSFGFSAHEPVIVMFAPFERTSDHPTFLRAAAHLIPHHPNARFVLAGEGQEAAIAAVKRLAVELHVSDRLIFDHDPASLHRWMQAADVGVHVSILESNSDSLLTCMAAGLPLVAARAGGNAEIIQHGQSGYLIDPLDADALAMRIHILLVADNVAAAFSAAAQNRVRAEFDIGREISNFSAYYRTLVYTSSDGWRRITRSSRNDL